MAAGPVDAATAEALKAPALYVTATPAGAAEWGDLAVDSEIISPFALAADATNEATRQAAFLGGPLVQDTHLVAGARRDLFGEFVRLTGDRLGYQNGAFAFVIGVTEAEDRTTTTLTVVRPLT